MIICCAFGVEVGGRAADFRRPGLWVSPVVSGLIRKTPSSRGPLPQISSTWRRAERGALPSAPATFRGSSFPAQGAHLYFQFLPKRATLLTGKGQSWSCTSAEITPGGSAGGSASRAHGAAHPPAPGCPPAPGSPRAHQNCPPQPASPGLLFRRDAHSTCPSLGTPRSHMKIRFPAK